MLRALRSVLSQTFQGFEIVVVVDGPDPESVAMLEQLGDSRVRRVSLPGASGGSRARNIGVQQATGEWIAFLDDDDEWMPEKLALQLEAAGASTKANPIVSTHIVVRSDEGDLHWPRRVPRADEPISEYLFLRSGLFSGDGQFQTSAILARRELLLACPFNEAIRKHDDTEWYLTVAARPDTEFIVLPELLTVWHQSHTFARVSHSGDWRTSLAWARSCRHLMTRKAYASFILSAVSAEAAETRALRGMASGLLEACRHGSPTLFMLLLPLGFVLFPKDVRHRLRQFRERLKGSARGAPSQMPPVGSSQRD